MPFWINIIIAAIAFAVSALAGRFLIPLLTRLKCGQTILEIGPRWHKNKEGTPTMGGFMFILGTLAAVLAGYFMYRGIAGGEAVSVNHGLRMLAGILFALLCSAMGFLDDYVKVVKKRNLGLTARQKLLIQFAIGALYLWTLRLLGDGTVIALPFFGMADFGIFYYPLMLLMITYLVNAFNLTDGVDGLCGSAVTVSALCLMQMALLLGNVEQGIFSVALAGACLGFLVWNFHPAKVMMGDTGSMFLGGAVVSVGMALGQPVLLALVCLLYVGEALSVVLQVISFKTTGKRIFKMSPIHHHFEMCKWSEYKIVIVFSLVSLIAGAAAVWILTFWPNPLL